MKKNYLSLLILMMFFAVTSSAQRAVDKLDRGLVAVKTTKGVFVSWRIQSEEYYGVTYNLYRNGTKIAEKLKTSNYTDAAGTTSSTYQVAAVVRGVEQAKTAATSTWANDYMEIVPKHPAALTSTYIPNDACCADVDGDGVVEILLKYDNMEESAASYPKAGNNGEYTLFEVLKLDGTVLWWVNCGPNMGDFQNNEQNIVGYDWDLDGKAEVVMRLSEGATIHYANGDTYTIGADGKNGTAWTNYRVPKTGGTEWFTHYGNEFLLYCNGSTGEPYQCIEYPLKRYEAGETDLKAAWGDGYGHRSSKYFFGAPYLDGRKPSIFLGRGIYTRHKFVALDVNPETHELTTRWRWTNNQPGSPWYGQGYHNYAIVDVDWDGRDEIVWGSMVIDDNGKGLSTTGLGHGDAQHHGDFNPYVRGQEGFFCNEDRPSNNYRDLTTSKIYHRATGSNDDGRAIAGNFNNVYPGAMGFSAHDDAISCVTGEAMGGMSKNGVAMNFNTYWDGDLCEETFNGGINTPGYIYKYGNGSAIKEFAGSITNNHSKSTPCFKGDILGDWREEFIMRTAANNIRIYTTTIETPWRNYSLWYDHQYRNGMVWQMCGYNQPPHVSYFLGELEGITQAPPSLGMTGRTEIANGQTISAKEGDIITCETNDMTVTVADGATPYIYIDNAPSWTQGSAPSEATAASYPINTTYYTHTLKGGAFAGEMRLVKQGEGILVLPDVTQLYSGSTDVWAGTLSFNGTLQNSRLWLNRLTTLDTDGGKFMKGIQADYGAVIRPGGKEAKAASLTTDSLILNFGAVCELDIYSDGFAADQLNANVLKIEKKVWPNGGGPEYDTPVFRINAHAAAGAAAIADGRYCLGTVAKVDGDLANITIEGLTHQKALLSCEDGKLYLNVQSYEGADMTWVGDKSGNWNLDNEANFKSDETGEAVRFVTGSNVTFDDNANVFTVKVDGKVAPASVTFNNTKAYTITGDSIVGASLVKTGAGNLTVNNLNRVSETKIAGGTLYAASLANSVGTDCGSLGTIDKGITISGGGALALSATGTSGHRIVVGSGNGSVNTPSGVTMTQTGAIAASGGTLLTKTGTGTFKMQGALYPALTVSAGTFAYDRDVAYTKQVTLEGTAAISGNGFVSSPVTVADYANVTWTLTNTYYKAYSGRLSGAGTITIVPTNTVSRVRITGNWSAFTGTVKYNNTSIVMPFDNSYGLPNATLDVAANCYVSNVCKTFAIGKITNGIFEHPVADFQSQAAVNGSNTWKVGNSTKELGDFTFNGKMYDAGGNNKCNFEKVGTCKMTVATTWENSGTVKVTEGELHLNSGKTVGKGALTVAEGATLSGLSGATLNTAKNKAMTNSSVIVNGTLQCGSSATSTTGYLCFGAKPLTLTSTSTLVVGLSRCATATSPGCTTIFGDASDASSVTIQDGATVKAFLSSTYDPANTVTAEKADSFRVFHSFAKVYVGKLKFDLPALPAHYYWDTDHIAEGYLYIRYTEQTGVNGVAAGEPVTVEVVDASGVKVAQYASTLSAARADFSALSLPKGIYILRIRDDKGNGGSITVRK